MTAIKFFVKPIGQGGDLRILSDGRVVAIIKPRQARAGEIIRIRELIEQGTRPWQTFASVARM